MTAPSDTKAPKLVERLLDVRSVGRTGKVNGVCPLTFEAASRITDLEAALQSSQRSEREARDRCEAAERERDKALADAALSEGSLNVVRAASMEYRDTIARLTERVGALEAIVGNTLWMARRYAHGRQSYAVGMYNDEARKAVALALVTEMTDGSVFALDGGDGGDGSPGLSGLSLEEFATARDGLNAVGITPHPDKFSPAWRRARALLDGTGAPETGGDLG